MKRGNRRSTAGYAEELILFKPLMNTDAEDRRPATQALFVPDTDETFDEQAFNRREDIRVALRDHPAVHAFIATHEEIYRYEEAHTAPRNSPLFAVKESEYAPMLHRKAELSDQHR